MEPVRIGIIGCGWFGNFHLENLLKIDGVKITALVSTNEDRLRSTALKAPAARLYADYHHLFSQEQELDGVFICVPPDCHGDIELLAAARGVHLYVEKPIELSLERAVAIESAIHDAGILSSCGYHERYNPVLEAARAYVSRQEVGVVAAQWLGDMPSAMWWRKRARSGGQLVEQCTHVIDQLRYFFGEAKSVYCRGVTGLIKGVPEYDIEDASSAVIDFASGIVATVQTGCYFGGTAPGRVGLRIYCRDSIVEYDWMNEVRYITMEHSETVKANKPSHFYAAQAFISAIQTGEASLIRSPYADGVKTLALTLAANRSIKTGLPISL